MPPHEPEFELAIDTKSPTELRDAGIRLKRLGQQLIDAALVKETNHNNRKRMRNLWN